MGTTKRQRRHARPDPVMGLSLCQKELLLYGVTMFADRDAPGFADHKSMERAWFAHRAGLEAEFYRFPQTFQLRPLGYFKFELKE